ncbi:CRE-CIDS-1 protein [Caenorhabditis remanei]|uniref:CRE-CIDS-1 protein n=1 Tax=Caenorhabditis remanei TaxID=31234 RepID=E3LT14_CAERE|nr:CRE-CIDS-1 protein [Caenorhabditis remanei]
MSDFTEQTLRQKLANLSNHSNSIQTTSSWLLNNHNNREIIIRVWIKVTILLSKKKRKVPKWSISSMWQTMSPRTQENHVHSSKRISSQLLKVHLGINKNNLFFQLILHRHCCEIKASKEVEIAIGKLIAIWKDRQIFSSSQCKRLQEVHQQMKLSKSFPSPASKDNGKNSTPSQFIVEEAKKNAQDVLLSLKRLQNPPSTEREIRVQLSKYPDNISCPEKLQSVQNSEEAKALLIQNEEALPMLEDYVKRLKDETKERETLEINLNLLIQNVRMSIEHHEKLCREVKRKEDRIKADLLEVEKTFESLPDLTAEMPNAPLPSLEALFQKRN